ncbi:MAG: bpX6 domain-containing protein [Kibdelosporangium sp.]
MTRLAFRGTVTAAGFVLDVPLIGETEARHRVLDWWGDGARLSVLPGGAWLVVLTASVSVLAERAPGLPLVERDGGLAAPGFHTERGAVGIPVGGAVRYHRIDELPLVDLAAWVDVTEIVVHHLKPAGSMPVSPRQPLETAPESPDLHRIAKIGRRSAKMERLLTPASPGAGIGRKTLLVMLVIILGAVAVAAAARGSIIVSIAVVMLVLGAVNNRRTGEEVAAQGRPKPKRQRDGWLARMLLRTPIGSLIRGRNEQYLRRLTRLFERKQWDEALREAIAIDGTGIGSLSLSLPKRRAAALVPSASVQSNGRAVPYGSGLTAHLRELYRTAASELERDGEVEQAAFVLADLLGDPAAAVTLLERHDRRQMAAELAEGRDLDPDLVVRLWWRAGRRDRALDVARARGAFAAAIDLLSRVDPAGAGELRLGWVQDRQRAGDHIGAVVAAWPVPGLREAVLTNIQSGMALGGTTAAHLFTYLLAQWPTAKTQEAALALLDSPDESLVAQRAQFVGTLAGLTVRDKAVDRMITTAALRAATRDLPVEHKLARQLIGRADPLMVADLPASRAPSLPGELALTAPVEPGQVTIHDAVTLGGGAILVALGELGVRLLTLDGRTRTRWSVPAHQLVVADHGGSALLVARYGRVSEIHRLDLATRRVRRWTSLQVREFLPSFDGSLAIAVDEDGLAFFDVHSAQPRVVWRELDRSTIIHAVRRSPLNLAAFVDVQGSAELWQWELPGMTLRGRAAVGETDFTSPLLADGFFRRGLGPLAQHTVSAGLVAFRAEHTEVYSAHETKPLLTAAFPHDEQLGIRGHAGAVTLWDSHGRLVAADITGRRALAAFSL